MYVIVTDKKDVVDYAHKNGAQIMRVSDQYSVNSESIMPDTTERDISKFLMDLGVPTHFDGFRYINYIIKESMDNPGFENKPITKIIYPTCAKFLGTTAQSVERGIRHAISAVFKNNTFLYQKIFGSHSKIPTNAQFISTIIICFKKDMYKY